MNTTNPCSCWLAPPSALHSGHCCFDTNAPEGCHDEVLDAAAEHAGSPRDAILALDTRTRARLLEEVIETRWPTKAVS